MVNINSFKDELEDNVLIRFSYTDPSLQQNTTTAFKTMFDKIKGGLPDDKANSVSLIHMQFSSACMLAS